MKKRLYLVRHAVAEERGPAWPDDTLRPLTERGQRRFAQAAAGFVQLEGIPERILTSPLVRARQTAELLASAADDAPIETLPSLSPGEPPAALLAKLRRAPAERIALVGHEPDLGQLAAVLLGASRPLPFKKGGMCRVDVEWRGKPTGTLVWFLSPAALRRMGD
jgi:phosphohistidine phosphatase